MSYCCSRSDIRKNLQEVGVAGLEMDKEWLWNLF